MIYFFGGLFWVYHCEQEQHNQDEKFTMMLDGFGIGEAPDIYLTHAQDCEISKTLANQGAA